MSITIIYTNQNINEYVSFEEITKIPNFNLVSKIDCFNNELISLPDNMNFPNLQELNCSNNELTTLPDDMNLPNLQYFNCSYNKLTSLPACILNFKNLHHNNNEIDLSLQIIKGECKREKKEERLNC
jgi:Leucine-rich repeat (LRR) protein